MKKWVIVLGCLLGCLVCAGCIPAHFPPPQTTLANAQAEFDVPPAKMLEKIKQIVSQPPVSVGVQSENKGTILTGYQDFPGEIHIARRWQERTQYQIQVVPDFDKPMEKCSVFVRQNTETRAADGMKWTPASDVNRDDRADALLKIIQQKAGQ